MSLRDELLNEIEAFLVASDFGAVAFGRAALGDGNFVLDMRRGRCPSLATFERVRAFMAANRPAKRMRKASYAGMRA